MLVNKAFKFHSIKFRTFDATMKSSQPNFNPTKNFNQIKLFFAGLFTFFISSHSVAQICSKKTSIYFESDQYEIQASENQKLQKLATAFNQKSDTFMLEIYAYSDSVASTEYNYKLSNKRSKSIIAILKKNSKAHFEIKERIRGEALPLSSNATEEGRAKNRRVEIVYWKVKAGKITLTGKGGTAIDLDKDYFGSCGVCESNPRMREVFTNEEAARQGIAMQTNDGQQLITAGMMNLDLSCPERNKRGAIDWPCRDMVIRIPAAEYDPAMELWVSNLERNGNASRWAPDYNGEMEYDAKNKCYILKVNYCPGRTRINCDKPAPCVIRGQMVIDTSGLIAVPELNRGRRGTYVKAMTEGKIAGRGGLNSNNMWQFYYRGKGSLFFNDSAIAKNKIGYVFSGIIDRYEAICDTAICRTLKQCWCFEIPLDAYSKIIYFQKNKNFRLKLPWKYRNYAVRLFIPAADTILPTQDIKSFFKKHGFKKPLPDTYIAVYKNIADANNKRAYDAQIDLSTIRTKYHKRRNYYKAKIKRRQLKTAIRSNS